MRLYLIIGVILALVGLYGYAHHQGYKERDAEMQTEIAAKNEEFRKKEQELNNTINAQATQLSEANHVIDQKQSSLDAAIRSGKLRLRTSSCVQTNSDSTTTTGDRDDAGSESDRQTLAAIAALVAEGQRNTEQLNACIAAYNEVREKVNGQ